MLTTCVNYIAKCLFMVVVVLIIYILRSMKKFKNADSFTPIPPFFAYFYDLLSENRVIKGIIENYSRNINLLSGSDSYSKIAVTSGCLLIPSLYFCMMYITVYLVSDWYYVLLLGVCELVIPYLFITNRIIRKSNAIRHSFVKIYENCERYFGNGYSVEDTITEIRYNTRGARGRILGEFLKIYSQDHEEAYNYLSNTIGDVWGDGFCKYVYAYDEEGIDPCESIRKLAIFADRDYSMREKMSRTCKSLSSLGGITFIIVVVTKVLAEKTAESLGTVAPFPVMTSVALFCVVLGYILVLYFERG